MKRTLLSVLLVLLLFRSFGQTQEFSVRGFHLDLRIQVMPMPALKAFARELHEQGINTLVMEWEGTYPFIKHPLVSNRYAYTRAEITGFIAYCNQLGLDVIPLQQSFGHVEYILRNDRYRELREDQKDYSQVCPQQVRQDSALFSELYADLAQTHTSRYIHIGGDETYLLGHDARCQKKVAEEGKSKLYMDYIAMLCRIVIRMGKKPVLWADIALKYPEAIHQLPKGTVLVDWNYGWPMNNFGEHSRLVSSGYEIWGAPSIRSYPDNYFLSEWAKHFNNIRDFVPACRKLGYQGMMMTSWSTSGAYSYLWETEENPLELYAIRHVYPISAYHMLLAAYAESLRNPSPLDVNAFVVSYAERTYGFSAAQATRFWKALRSAPYQVVQGRVDTALTLSQVLDSAQSALAVLEELKPKAAGEEFRQYRLMAGIRVDYLQYEQIEQEANRPDFDRSKIPELLPRLKRLLAREAEMDAEFDRLNRSFLYPGQLAEERDLRDSKTLLLYARLSGQK